MAKTRLLNPPAKKTAATPVDWDRLMRLALVQAEKTGDPRTALLRNAASQGQAAQALKRMGIIGENDLQREFPIPVS